MALPTYPFRRVRYPLVKAGAVEETGGGGIATGHPILGARLEIATLEGAVFQSRLEPRRPGFLSDHRIHGLLVLPSPAYIEAMLAAAAEVGEASGAALENLVITDPLVVSDGGTVVQTILETGEGGARVRVFSREGSRWRLHAEARIRELLDPEVMQEDPAAAFAGARARCSRTLDVAGYYRTLGDLGLEFGPQFRGMKRLWRGNGEVLVQVERPVGLGSGDDSYAWIHPALMDACLHGIGAALPGAGQDVDAPLVLMGIDRLRFHAQAHGEVWAHVRLLSDEGHEPGSNGSLRADMRMFTGKGDLVADARGLLLRRAPRGAFRGVAERGVDALLHEVAWRNARVTASGAAAPSADGESRAIAPASAVALRLGAGLEDVFDTPVMKAYDRMLPMLDLALGRSVVRALEGLGWRFEPGRPVEVEGVAERCGVAKRHHRLLVRLLEMLDEDGVLTRSGAGWRVAGRSHADGDPDALFRDLQRGFPDFEIELELARRCAAALGGVLRGEVDPLELLFPGGSLHDAERLYGETPSARAWNDVVAKAVHLAVEDLPAGRRLRILEVGAGTGGTTARVLPVLPEDRTDYLFTDVSRHFLRRARKRFGRCEFIRFAELDVSRDPTGQGLVAHDFDLVIAANVLHATPDVGRSLRGVRDLLAPSGLLVLYEVVARHRFADLTVGLTEGWWSFTDESRRPRYPLLSREGWSNALAEAGFADAVPVPGEHAEGAAGGQAVILAGTVGRWSAPPPSAEEGRGSWLVHGPRGPGAEAVAQALRRRGKNCLLISPGTGAAEYGAPEELARVLASSSAPPEGVIHLVFSEEPVPDGVAEVADACRRVTGAALALVQAVARAGWPDPPLLTMVTRGGQATAGDESADPVQATLWGFSHTLALEHPELRPLRIDLDPGWPLAASAESLVAEVLQRRVAPDEDREDQVALRDGTRRVRRIIRSARPAPADRTVRFRRDGSYLITGGLGGVGRLVARWMVERGARNLVLLGRSEPDAGGLGFLEDLERAGARVVAARGDVSDPAVLDRVLEEMAGSMPPLAGVFHSAGVLDDGTLLHQDRGRFETVLAPKAFGAWNLHLRTRQLALDHFVLFSSGVGLLGAPGQGNHSAANAFLDALAHHRRALGLPALTINWGAWRGVGAAGERGLEKRTRAFSAEQALAALERALPGSALSMAERAVQVAVLPAEWETDLGEERAADPLFMELRHVAAGSPARARQAQAQLHHRLRAAPPHRRREIVQAHIRSLAAEVLALSEEGVIGLHQPLQEVGLDSLMAVELRNALGQSANRSLPATLLFQHPTVAELAAVLEDPILTAAGARDPVDGTAPGAGDGPVPADAGDRLAAEAHSDDDVAGRLLRKLEQLDALN
ncbi:MAG: SDR family NAD(P)-dependent oxidoreductase [Gemmatimonadales bacterium]|nr:MAG: SDR family NAD(P)-dependent oxidoreductase [Gemmatimonadales bacterium]